ncbi:FxsA family protein [Candidatus Omnitrophota bacterium]
MFGYLVLLFTVVPALELAVLIKVGSFIGVGNTLTIIILTGVVGAYLARLQGFLILQEIQGKLNQGLMPSAQLLDGLMVLVGGILLLTPGFITDVMGFLLLVPFTRAILKLIFNKYFKAMIDRGEASHRKPPPPQSKIYDDIDIN